MPQSPYLTSIVGVYTSGVAYTPTFGPVWIVNGYTASVKVHDMSCFRNFNFKIVII
jgi:hypothetical protein